MSKKVLPITLVLFGLVFSQIPRECFADASAELEQARMYEKDDHYEQAEAAYKAIVTDYPGTDYALEAQKNLTMLYIVMDRQDDAGATLQELIANFTNNKGTVKAVHDIARHYGEFEKYDKAKQLFQYVMTTWPEDEHAMWSQAGVAKLHISTGKMEDAQAAVDKLVTDFSDHELIAGGVWYVAQHCKALKKYEKSKELYQYIINNWPRDEYVLWSQSCLAMSHIGLDEMKAADAAIEKLVADFNSDERIAEAVYDIADQYKRFGHCERAKQIYQSVLDTWPPFKYTTWTKIGLAQSNIRLGDTTAAESIIDGLVAEFDANTPSDSNLPTATIELFYYAGECYRRIGKYEKSNTYYQKAIDDCPDCEYTWNALFMVGRNYQDLKESGTVLESDADAKTQAAYEQLIDNYPDCKAAGSASDWLSRRNSK